MKEIWKPIENFDKYEVSNTGKIRSLDRETYNKGSGKMCRIKGKELIPQPNSKTGRLYVNLYDKNNKPKNRMVSRIVAETFLENIENLPEVNHIDRDVTNNSVENLEWVTPKQNMEHLSENYGFNFGRVSVIGINVKTLERIAFDTLKSASEYLTKIRGKKTHESGISNVINGNRKTAYGYYWEKSNLETIESITYCREDN